MKSAKENSRMHTVVTIIDFHILLSLCLWVPPTTDITALVKNLPSYWINITKSCKRGGSNPPRTKSIGLKWIAVCYMCKLTKSTLGCKLTAFQTQKTKWDGKAACAFKTKKRLLFLEWFYPTAIYWCTGSKLLQTPSAFCIPTSFLENNGLFLPATGMLCWTCPWNLSLQCRGWHWLHSLQWLRRQLFWQLKVQLKHSWENNFNCVVWS